MSEKVQNWEDSKGLYRYIYIILLHFAEMGLL